MRKKKMKKLKLDIVDEKGKPLKRKGNFYVSR
jgi:hypothetical protein